MEKLISNTEDIAFKHFKAFGFKDEQIDQLILQGTKDLCKELTKLKVLLEASEISYDDVNNVLHALKGLLFQLGNHEVAEKLVEIRSNLEDEDILKDIAELYN